MDKKVKLEIEGGGIRGAFSLGVLNSFIENMVEIEEIYGISAGAITGAFYSSNQRISLGDLSKIDKGRLNRIGKDKGLNLKEAIPIFVDDLSYNYGAYLNSNRNLHIGAFDFLRGEMVFYEKDENIGVNDFFMEIMASSSLPGISPYIEINGIKLYDGGVKMPIPVFLDGSKEVIILSHDITYKRKEDRYMVDEKTLNKLNKEFREVILSRNRKYNETLEEIRKEEEKGNIFVFRPSKRVDLKTFDKDIDKALDLYMDGYKMGHKRLGELKEFLNK